MCCDCVVVKFSGVTSARLVCGAVSVCHFMACTNTCASATQLTWWVIKCRSSSGQGGLTQQCNRPSAAHMTLLLGQAGQHKHRCNPHSRFGSSFHPSLITCRLTSTSRSSSTRSGTSSSMGSTSASSAFDTAAYDAERLRLDDQARQAMIAKASSEASVEQELPGSKPGAWKWDIRKKMWDHMEAHDIARFPRPVHHRIPNFIDADKAADNLKRLPEFQAAKVVKVNPDTPQKMVRYAVLSTGKTLLTPQPRLRTGFFSTLSSADFFATALMEACTSAGAAKYGTPLGLDASIKVDMIVVGSSAVSPNGARLGKGEGFAELEYGILKWMGAIDDSTPVVTTIHDCQLLDEVIPPERMLEHDVPVDIIVTPTQMIRTNSRIAKPPGILWHRLSPQKLAQIRVLQQLKERIQQETGQPLLTGPDEELPPLAARGQRPRGRGRGNGGRGGNRRVPKRAASQQ